VGLKVAIVHYWLVGMRGGERVLERILNLYPNADIFTHAYAPERVSDVIRAANVKTTFIQKLPGATKHYQKYLPLMPRALEALDLSDYDLVISSEAGPAKGVIAKPDAAHVCYCHSPMRYLWDQAPLYRKNAGFAARMGMDLFSHGLRTWDVTSAQRVDRFMANSNFIASRIRKYYRRQSQVVFPPVDIDAFSISPDIEPHYLWLGQMTAYKRPDLAVEAFNRLGLPLLMVGDGEMEPKLRATANSNIKFAKNLPFAELKKAYATARGLIFTAEEDFGIVPVEMMASGRPVLAFQRGGALDTVTDEISGRFFDDASVDGLIAGIQDFERFLTDFSPESCKESVARFAPEHFDAGFQACVLDALAETSAPRAPVAPYMARLERAAE
jgi:glycosyltransferase involved in cell wall biosynthesis